MRRWLSTFLSVSGVHQCSIEDVLSASGEALANSVEHAYHGAPNYVQMKCYCCAKHTIVLVEIEDLGKPQPALRDARPAGRGFGFAIMRKLAEEVNVRSRGGTAVTLKFHPTGVVH